MDRTEAGIFDIAAHIMRSSGKTILTIAGLWLLLYASFTLFRPPLLDDADSVHAEVAREMVARHDWITLYANGIRYLEKAPLMYWSMAASFTLFGPQDWAARLPLAIYALALFLTVYAAGRRMFASEMAGFYAALILLTSFGIFIYTRIIIPDVIVCLWLSLSMLLFWISLEQPSRATAWGFAAACALNVLTKGLIGIVFPLAIVIIFLLLQRNLGHLRRWHPLSSLLVFLLIALPWHIAAGIANPSQGHGCPREFFLVLFRQRTGPPLSQPADSAGLRHRPAPAFLGLACRLARAVDRLRVQGSRLSPKSSVDFALHMGRMRYGLLQLLHSPGILCIACVAAHRPDDRRLAGAGREMLRSRSAARRGTPDRCGSVSVGRRWLRARRILSPTRPTPRPGCGYLYAADAKSRGVRTLAGPLSRPEHANHGRLSPAALADRDCSGGGNAGQLDPTLHQPDPDGELCARRYDGGLPDRCSHGSGDVFARTILKGFGGCDPAADHRRAM